MKQGVLLLLLGALLLTLAGCASHAQVAAPGCQRAPAPTQAEGDRDLGPGAAGEKLGK